MALLLSSYIALIIAPVVRFVLLGCVGTTVMVAQLAPRGEDSCSSVPGREAPTLTALVPISDFVQSLSASAPDRFRNARGLIIEDVYLKEITPVLPMIFFDEGKADIPERYQRYSAPSLTATHFHEEGIRGGALQKQWEILNVIGFRMRRYPDTKVSIRGHDSKQPKLRETSSIAEQRALAVYRYLHEIWQIDPARLTIAPSGGYPRATSNPRNPVTNVENRRVEILSENWEIVKPIVSHDIRRYVHPPAMRFRMQNGIPDSLVARREIEISRRGSSWYTMRNLSIGDSLSPPYEWGKEGNRDSIPATEFPYIAQLVVYTKDGRQCRSLPIEIPVVLVTDEVKWRRGTDLTRREQYTIALFDFESSRVSGAYERILKEYIIDGLRTGAQVDVTGYSSGESKGEKLSADRASAVVAVIGKLSKPGILGTLESSGAAETTPLHKNEYPEERFLARSVQVRVVSRPPGH